MDQAIGNTASQFGDAPALPAGAAAPTDERTREAHDAEPDAEGRHVYAGREWSSDHPLNVRISIPLGIGRYYVAFVAGKERRARARLALDRRQHPLDTPSNVVFLAFIAAIATAGSLTLLYLLLAHIFGWSGRLIL